MKIDLLKTLIKESLKEVIKEELPLILKSIQTNESNVLNLKEKTERIDSKRNYFNKQEDFTKNKQINEILNLTKSEMNPTDFAKFNNSEFTNTKLYVNEEFKPTDSNYSTVPNVGVDISKLNFVKNAANIFNASLEKDRSRNGI